MFYFHDIFCETFAPEPTNRFCLQSFILCLNEIRKCDMIVVFFFRVKIYSQHMIDF